MKHILLFLLLALLGLQVYAQNDETRTPEPSIEEAQDQELTDQQPSVQDQEQELQDQESQETNDERTNGLAICKARGAFPGPNAVIIQPGMKVNFAPNSGEMVGITFSAAPSWAPNSFSECTVPEGRQLPTPRGRVQCGSGGITFGIIKNDDRLLIHNLRRNSAVLVEPPTFQIEFYMLNETTSLNGCMTVAYTEWGIGILNKDCRLEENLYVCTSLVGRHGELEPV